MNPYNTYAGKFDDTYEDDTYEEVVLGVEDEVEEDWFTSEEIAMWLGDSRCNTKKSIEDFLLAKGLDLDVYTFYVYNQDNEIVRSGYQITGSLAREWVSQDVEVRKAVYRFIFERENDIKFC